MLDSVVAVDGKDNGIANVDGERGRREGKGGTTCDGERGSLDIGSEHN
jgi:hypothetical protein